jgi:hypothetical protein
MYANEIRAYMCLWYMPVRCTLIGYTPRCILVRYMPIHASKVHAGEIHAYEMHVLEMHGLEIQAYKVHAYEMLPMRCTHEMRAYEVPRL